MAKPARKIQPGQDVGLASVQNDIPHLDRMIHEKLRLGILSALAAAGPLPFSELKRLLETTDGNLSIHARKLEDAGFVACEKSFNGRVPQTEYKLTKAGRAALDRYLDHMEALLHAMRGARG